MKKIFNKKNGIFGVLVLFIIAGIGTSAYYYRQYQQIKNNPNIVAQTEIKKVTDIISKYMVLPEGEDPTLATVTDKEKLKSQDFFKNSENGDKILIYTKARKAILFRPSTGKVIEFAPLIIGDNVQNETQENTQLQTEANTQPVRVVIYNGTKINGLTADTEKKISNVKNISIISKVNATKPDYKKSVIIDLTGSNSQTVDNLAQVINAEVSSSIPEGETRPEGDILIIAGNDE